MPTLICKPEFLIFRRDIQRRVGRRELFEFLISFCFFELINSCGVLFAAICPIDSLIHSLTLT